MKTKNRSIIVFAIIFAAVSTLNVLAAAPDTIGNQKTLVLLVNFLDNTSEPITPAQAGSVVFTDVNNYFIENSYGKLSISGDVLGWYTLNINSTCSLIGIVQEAVKTVDPFVYFPDYARLILTYPAKCGYGGVAYIGRIMTTTDDGTVPLSWAGILPKYFDVSYVGHEYAHNLGLYHANARDCGSSVTGSDTACTNIEYGDQFDILGIKPSGFVSKNHLNAIHKAKLDWLNSTEYVQITTDGTYTLNPIESVASMVKSLVTWKVGTPPIFYEYRQPIGFDSNLPSNVLNGLLVHLTVTAGTGDTQILDNTPETASWSDPALGVGGTFNDVLSGVKVNVLSKDQTALTFSVTFPPTTCIRSNPTVSIAPSSQWGQSGSSLSYTVTVTNNDNSLCSSSTFSLASSVPSGWSSAFDISSASLSSGATGTATMTLTSPATEIDGFYDFNVTATNNDFPSFNGYATATYVVSNLDTTPPTVFITGPADGTAVPKGSTVSINATASDNVGVNKVEFYVNNKLTCSDSTLPYSCPWKVPNPKGRIYTLQAKAYDIAGNSGISNVVKVTSS